MDKYDKDDRWERLNALAVKFGKKFTDEEKAGWIRSLKGMDYTPLVKVFMDIEKLADRFPRLIDVERTYQRILTEQRGSGRVSVDQSDPDGFCAYCENSGLVPYYLETKSGFFRRLSAACKCTAGKEFGGFPRYFDLFPDAMQIDWNLDEHESYVGAFIAYYWEKIVPENHSRSAEKLPDHLTRKRSGGGDWRKPGYGEAISKVSPEPESEVEVSDEVLADLPF